MPDTVPAADNPYAPPLAPNGASADAGRWSHQTFAQVRKLRYLSHAIRALGALFLFLAGIFAAAGIGLVLYPTPKYAWAWFLLFFAVLTALGCHGAWARPAWGRLIGIVICLLFLATGWIGCVIGILGLVVLVAAGGNLFGPHRLRHHEVEAEFRRQRAERLRVAEMQQQHPG